MKPVCNCHQSHPKSCMATSSSRQSLPALSGIVSGILLALMPKCPVCIAAYITFLTGVGLSTPAAGFLRISFITVCSLSLTIAIIVMIKKRWLDSITT